MYLCFYWQCIHLKDFVHFLIIVFQETFEHLCASIFHVICACPPLSLSLSLTHSLILSLSLSFSLVRGILSLVVSMAFISFTRSIRDRFGPMVARFLIIVTLSQFHFLFYTSRPLPNIFALALGELSLFNQI